MKYLPAGFALMSALATTTLLVYAHFVFPGSPTQERAPQSRVKLIAPDLYVYDGDHVCVYYWGSQGVAAIQKPSGWSCF